MPALLVNFLSWKGVCPPKVELFVWQLLKGRVMVGNVLQRFGFSLALRCPFCKADVESLSHVFLLCPWSWKIWQQSMSRWGMSSCMSRSVAEWWES